jgi:hypothetical protein
VRSERMSGLGEEQLDIAEPGDSAIHGLKGKGPTRTDLARGARRYPRAAAADIMFGVAQPTISRYMTFFVPLAGRQRRRLLRPPMTRSRW